jgi:multidrug efflux system membrane fusion protein
MEDRGSRIASPFSILYPRSSILGLLTAYCLLFLIGCGSDTPVEKPPIPVKVQAVEMYSSDSRARYSANIEPKTQVNLAFKVGGYLDAILQVRGVDGRLRDVQEGDVVTKGTVLAHVRQSDYVAKVNQASAQLAEARSALGSGQAQLAEAQAAFERARLDFDRATNLLASQSTTKAEYDGAKAQFDVSQARVNAAKTQLDTIQAKIGAAEALVSEAEIALQDCELKAPMNGVVLQRMVEIGTLVGPGTPGFILADTTSVKAVFGVPDRIVQIAKLGIPLTINTESILGVDFEGRITAISPSADPASRVFNVEVTIPNPRNQLKAGMIATVEVPGEAISGQRASAAAPVVPLTAIVKSPQNPNGYAVFVVEGREGKQVARLHNVKVGEVYGNNIAVNDGVKLKERVIVTGATLVVDGEPVRVIP